MMNLWVATRFGTAGGTARVLHAGSCHEGHEDAGRLFKQAVQANGRDRLQRSRLAWGNNDSDMERNFVMP